MYSLGNITDRTCMIAGSFQAPQRQEQEATEAEGVEVLLGARSGEIHSLSEDAVRCTSTSTTRLTCRCRLEFKLCHATSPSHQCVRPGERERMKNKLETVNERRDEDRITEWTNRSHREQEKHLT